MSETRENGLGYCKVCDVTLSDPSVLEAHFTGKKHLKKIRSLDLQAQQEGKAVFVTHLGSLKLPEIMEYMSTFGVVVNLCPGKDNKNPDRLHHVIVEYESEEVVARILSRDLRHKHKIEVPDSSPPQYQSLTIYERKFKQRRRSPSPPECPGVSEDQVVMRLNLIFSCEDQLEELSKLLNISIADVHARIGICEHLERTFRSAGHTQCVVHPFGSSRNGLGFPGCDLDIYLDLGPANTPGGELEDVPVQMSEKQKVRVAQRVLSDIKQISRVTAILSARVPILKFIHRPTGIHCDISFKNRLSVKNTEYIRLCLDTDSRVRPLLIAVRFWAKHYGLAGGGGGMKMSSYALTILVITFLQQLDRPLLHTVLELQSVPSVEPDIINGWNSNFCSDLSQLRSLPVNTATSLELLAGFFQFISSLELDSVVLCPLLGKVLPRSELSTSYPDSVSTSSFLSNTESLQLDKPLCLQDPFELSHNVCRGLPERAVKRLVLYCKEAAKLVQQCLSVDQRPSGGLCSILKLEVAEVEEEKVSNIESWLLQLTEEQAKLFQQNVRIKIPAEYLDWFRKQPGLDDGESVLIACIENILDVCFGDCLKLTKHSQNLPSESAQSIKEVNSTEEAKISGKRSSLEADLDEIESPVKRKKTNLVYKAGANWSVWDLVWVRRKQVLEQIDKTNKSTVEVEAAITEAITKDCIRLADPEAEFRLHYLTPRDENNSLLLMVGIQKVQSRKKSFESIVTWLKSYIPYLVKMIVQDKLQDIGFTMLLQSIYLQLLISSFIQTIYSFNIVGYMPEWRHEGADFDRLCSHLTHLIFFSLEMTPRGDIIALDRLPRPELMAEARAAASKHKTKLLVCFGGNGRSGGFSVMVRNDNNRKLFLQNLVKLLDQYGLDGVDYNWEYPGYRMGRGYLDEKEIMKDYEGLAKLIKETKSLFAETGRFVSMAYYPDTRQERLMRLFGLDEEVDLMFSMSYDQGAPNHSSRELAKQTIKQADNANLVMSKLCLGLPFYGRNNQGEWTTYEDLVQQHDLTGKEDEVVKDGVKVGLNGKNTIGWKVKLAVTEKIGGVMIWEVGQDCRVSPVTRGDTVHVATCPRGEDSSLLAAITNTRRKYKPADAARDEF